MEPQIQKIPRAETLRRKEKKGLTMKYTKDTNDCKMYIVDCILFNKGTTGT
jgi:hypothetical protein